MLCCARTLAEPTQEFKLAPTLDPNHPDLARGVFAELELAPNGADLNKKRVLRTRQHGSGR